MSRTSERDRLEEEVLSRLDMNPMHLYRLASYLGMQEPRSTYLKLLDVVSDLETGNNQSDHPKLKHATPVKLDGQYVYPIYRVDQEKALIEDGRLSEKEQIVDLLKVAQSNEMKLPDFLSFLKK